MSEQVITYHLDQPDTPVPMERDEFYREQIEVFKKTGKPTKAVEIIDIFIFDEEGELILQKRSDHKNHNPGLMDKSIGGHIQYGDSPEYTVMVETIQELQVPSITAQTDEDFQKTYKLLKNYLSTVAIIKYVGVKMHSFEKIIKGEKVLIANKKHLYFGVYTGAVKTVDREAKGVLLYNLNDLEKEMQESPDTFTYDLKFYMKEYKGQMEEFIEKAKNY